MLDQNPPLTAEDLRMIVLKKEMEAMDAERAAAAAIKNRHAEFAREFLSGHVSEKERQMIRQLVLDAAQDGKLEALVYSFPSDLCTDRGRAINSGDPDWPRTLQGKARELYDIYRKIGRPEGYRLKAMIINFPGGMPGDVGFFLNWGGEQH
jgi:hypothetical protein